MNRSSGRRARDLELQAQRHSHGVLELLNTSSGQVVVRGRVSGVEHVIPHSLHPKCADGQTIQADESAIQFNFKAGASREPGRAPTHLDCFVEKVSRGPIAGRVPSPRCVGGKFSGDSAALPGPKTSTTKALATGGGEDAASPISEGSFAAPPPPPPRAGVDATAGAAASSSSAGLAPLVGPPPASPSVSSGDDDLEAGLAELLVDTAKVKTEDGGGDGYLR